MLKSLKINNIAVIENAQAVFSHGFNVLTGETGAGKSIIVDSINAILGERTSRDLIRRGTDKATVVAVFCDVSDYCRELMTSYDIEEDCGEYVIQRIISENGKGSSRINGIPVNNKTLREIGHNLISIHGQHDSQSLLNPENHCNYLDSFAENSTEIDEYKAAFKYFSEVRRKLKTVIETENDLKEKFDLLSFQTSELSAANLKIGETEELKEEIRLLENSENVISALGAFGADFSDDADVTEVLDNILNGITKVAGYSEDVKNISDKLTDIVYELKALKSDAAEISEKLGNNARSLDEKRARLHYISTLKTKYNRDEKELVRYLEDCKKQLESINNNDTERRFLESEIVSAQQKLILSAEKLTNSRKKASKKLASDICNVLKLLDMEDVVFLVDIKEVPYNKNGKDFAEFFISANKGQSLMPLSKVASGGELSRIMLAIKSVIADKDRVDTLIFDEIDTGISGRAARKVGLQLKKVSDVRQVICITHLAQIAALADNHLLISKKSHDNATYTSVTPIADDERINELARIMSGTDITENLFNTAKELLEQNKE